MKVPCHCTRPRFHHPSRPSPSAARHTPPHPTHSVHMYIMLALWIHHQEAIIHQKKSTPEPPTRPTPRNRAHPPAPPQEGSSDRKTKPSQGHRRTRTPSRQGRTCPFIQERGLCIKHIVSSSEPGSRKAARKHTAKKPPQEPYAEKEGMKEVGQKSALRCYQTKWLAMRMPLVEFGF